MESSGIKERRVIKYGFFLRNKKYFLYAALSLSIVAVAYNIIGFFTRLFKDAGWALAFVSLPFVIASVCFTSFRCLRSKARIHRNVAWVTCGLNVLAILLIAVTAVPAVNGLL